MSKFFKDINNVLDEAPVKNYGKLANEIDASGFATWIQRYIEKTGKSSLHNITSYRTEPITLIFDDTIINIPLNIFLCSPASIEYISVLDEDKPVYVSFNTPYVLNKDNTGFEYIIGEDDMDVIEYMTIKGNISDIKVSADFNTIETFNRFFNYLIDHYNKAAISVNYTSRIMDNPSINIAAYIMTNSKFVDKVEIIFKDEDIIIDDSQR